MSDTPTPTTSSEMPSPGRCLTGAVVAGGLAFACYNMMYAIAVNFASHPLISQNLTTQRISAAVRTLVLGMTTLATGVFGLATLGLVGLAIQLMVNKSRSSNP